MKLLVFAHTPPPHHGQSYMVQLMLDRLQADPDIECVHVNSRFSAGPTDVGRFQIRKLFRVIRYAVQAIWRSHRDSTDAVYYVPGPGSRASLYRDWLVMATCRPFLKKWVYHWHAAGLGRWLQEEARPWERSVSCFLMGSVDLSIVLSDANRNDAESLNAKRIERVPNGIPDSCPDYDQQLREMRRKRFHHVASAMQKDRGPPSILVNVLYLGLCYREKGLFDAVEAISLANRAQADKGSPVRYHLTVAGTFWSDVEKQEFEERIKATDLVEDGPFVEYIGFIEAEQKKRILRESDCLVFPTYYAAESFGLVLLEAMAWGLPVIATRWRSIPEIVPPDYPGLVEPKSPHALADRLQRLFESDWSERLRDLFIREYRVDRWGQRLEQALLSVGNDVS